MSVPPVDTLIVDPTAVARKLGVADPTPAFLAAVADAVLDAQADAQAYLGRPLLPAQYVQTCCYPYLDGWRLDEDPVLEIVTAVAETYPLVGGLTGLYTVTYIGGLDARVDSPDDCSAVRRWVKAAAANDPTVIRAWSAGGAVGLRRSVTTDGQSVTFDNLGLGGGGQAGTDSPGALPSKSSMDALRRRNRRVYTAPTPPLPAGPGSGYTYEGDSTDPYARRDPIWY